MSENEKSSDVRLRDPLSKVTRAERKLLLGVSAIGIVIAKSGLVPSKISALGVDFDRADQTALLKMLSAVVFYFVIAFLVYAGSDLIAWRVSFYDAVRDRMLAGKWETGRSNEFNQESIRKFTRRSMVWSRVARPMSLVRALFEFAIPIVIGVYAIYALGTTSPQRLDSSTLPAGITQPIQTPSDQLQSQPRSAQQPTPKK